VEGVWCVCVCPHGVFAQGLQQKTEATKRGMTSMPLNMHTTTHAVCLTPKYSAI